MTSLTPGFLAPVADAQRCFRAVLDAMSRPGRLHSVPAPQPPPAMSSAAAAVVLTLLDHETPLWMDGGTVSARGWIEFHCGAPVMKDPARAAFVLASRLPDLCALNAGTYEQPEASATVILELAGLGSGRSWRLSGPGLREPVALQADGLPDDFAARWAANHAGFPCGVDLILCAGDMVTALPRTVMVEEV